MRPGAFGLVFALLFAGCVDPLPASEGDADPVEPWDGVLYAYRGHGSFNTSDADGTPLPDRYAVDLLPTPGAPASVPAACRTLSTTPEARNVTCSVHPPQEWPGGVSSAYAHPSCDGPQPSVGRVAHDGERRYRFPWFVTITWEGAPQPDRERAAARLANWSAVVADAAGVDVAEWQGTVGWCYSAVFGHGRGPVAPYLDWTWQAGNSTLMSDDGTSTVSFGTDLGGCTMLTVNATVDEYGFRLRLFQGEDEIWETGADADPARTTPEALPPLRHVIVDPPNGSQYRVTLDHAAAPPASPDLAQTVVHVEARPMGLAEPCP